MKFYGYKQCGTCRKAQKWLEANGIEAEMLPIRDTPPTATELKKMLKLLGGNRKPMLNTSSKDYRAEGVKEQLLESSDKDFIDLLRENGNLIKRPFVLTADSVITGFKEDALAELFPS